MCSKTNLLATNNYSDYFTHHVLLVIQKDVSSIFVFSQNQCVHENHVYDFLII